MPKKKRDGKKPAALMRSNDKLKTGLLLYALLHRGVSLATYRSEHQNLLDCGLNHAAMTTASQIDMTSFFCRDALHL